MPTYGFFVEFEARDGKQDEVKQFLEDARIFVDDEPGTLAWFAFQIGGISFRIFDAFDIEDARAAHLQGKVREAIETHGSELFATPPVITPVDILASKHPAV